MEYKCSHCEWSGTWDELILETLCPKCRSSAVPIRNNDDPAQQVTQTTHSYMFSGAPPQ
jgi:Zn finger protein HypA/HybF involved in hydrogenase expression